MKKALKGDKISHIYFIVRLIITCIGFSLLALGVNLSKTPAYVTSIDGELGQSLSGLSIVIGAIGFFIVVYCVIVFAIGVADYEDGKDKVADERLYLGKKSGKNKIVYKG